MHLVLHYFSIKFIANFVTKVEMTKIDQLPTEVLMKIFGYLRSYGNISLVSRRFYDVACSVPDSVSFSSIFKKENGNDRSVMDSVLNTRRKISKLSIDFGFHIESLRKSAISDAVEIVKKFSATIKHFELRHVRMSDFLEMLKWLPNAEHLMFYDLYDNRSPTDHQLSNACLNLHRLKTLELSECSAEFLHVFNRLPAGVLKRLHISDYRIDENLDWDILAGVLTQQSNIKELKLDTTGDSTAPDHIIDHLKLESLEFYQRVYNSRHVTMLSKQTKLIRLRLRGGKVDDQILNVITSQLSELETLAIRVDEAQVVSFKRIEKLKKLKELTLQTSSLKIIETLAGLDNSRITTLNMVIFNIRDIIPIDVIAALAISLPNLKVLRFDRYYEYQNVAAVLQNFNFLEVLEMTFDPRIDASGLCQAIEVCRCFNPKLTELNIADFPCDESVLTKFAAVYPNLKKLDIEWKSSITLPLFKAILTGFKTMESLSLYGFFVFSTEYVECIMKHKNHLKSITLGYVDSEFTAEHKKELRAVFDVTKYEDGVLHLAN